MPATNRWAGRSYVGAEQMCRNAPQAVEQLMGQMVRGCSPNWETLRITVSRDHFTNSWRILLDVEGLPRG